MASPHEDDARQYVLRTAKENDVKFIRLWFTDILGSLKGFAITEAELEGALEYGMAFDGSTVEGFARKDESDMVAMPDPTTFSILPWRPRQNAVARMFCDVIRPSGEPFEGDPRYVLKQALEYAGTRGYTFYAGCEIEHPIYDSDLGVHVLERLVVHQVFQGRRRERRARNPVVSIIGRHAVAVVVA